MKELDAQIHAIYNRSLSAVYHKKYVLEKKQCAVIDGVVFEKDKWGFYHDANGNRFIIRKDEC
jgi:hypothetical protein